MESHSASLYFFADPAGGVRAYLVIADHANLATMLEPGNRIAVAGRHETLPSGDHGEAIFVSARRRLLEVGWRPVARFAPSQHRRDIFAVDLRRRDPSTAGVRDLGGRDLAGADLVGESFRSVRLAGADLSRARLDHADLESADLSGADLRCAGLSGTRFARASLRGANLDRCTTDGNTVLDGADLSAASVTGVELRGVAADASFRDADFRGSTLRLSMRGCDFSGADLSAAGLAGASLAGADLGTARLPALDAFDRVLWTPETVWPEFLRPEVLQRSVRIRGAAPALGDSGLYELHPTEDDRRRYESAGRNSARPGRPRRARGLFSRWRRSS